MKSILKKALPSPLVLFLQNLRARIKALSIKKKSQSEMHEFWKLRDNNPKPSHEKRSEYLLKQITKLNLQTSSSILEIGCNWGRNLKRLYVNNFKNLHGIEISDIAIEKLKKNEPEMASQIEVILGTIEDYLPKLSPNHFDLIVSMAVLSHIHPNNEWVFEDISRVTKKFLITVDDENTVSDYHTPRNYKSIFEQYGLKQIHQEVMGDNQGFSDSYICRIFQK